MVLIFKNDSRSSLGWTISKICLHDITNNDQTKRILKFNKTLPNNGNGFSFFSLKKKTKSKKSDIKHDKIH